MRLMNLVNLSNQKNQRIKLQKVLKLENKNRILKGRPKVLNGFESKFVPVEKQSPVK